MFTREYTQTQIVGSSEAREINLFAACFGCLLQVNVVPTSPILVTMLKKAPPKRQLQQDPHGIIAQKATFLISVMFRVSSFE
jgi:hypothetical protein